MRKQLIIVVSVLALLLGGLAVSSAQAAGGAPRWPRSCDTHSMLFLDYTADAPGYPSHRKAAKKWMRRDDTLLKQDKQGPHTRKHWLVVKPNNRIRASLTMFRHNGGYLVDSVEKCAR